VTHATTINNTIHYNSTELSAIIQSRRSIRRYTTQPVTPALIEALLTLAIWAPSAHNRQPWRFAPVLDQARRIQLAQAMGDRLQADRLADGDPPAIVAADVARSYQRITSAPALIVICTSLIEMDHYPDARRSGAELVMATQSTAMAVQNLLLSAHAHGLGACWLCAPLFCPEVVAAALDLPADWQPQALITLGYPAEEKIKPRAALETKILWR